MRKGIACGVTDPLSQWKFAQLSTVREIRVPWSHRPPVTFSLKPRRRRIWDLSSQQFLPALGIARVYLTKHTHMKMHILKTQADQSFVACVNKHSDTFRWAVARCCCTNLAMNILDNSVTEQCNAIWDSRGTRAVSRVRVVYGLARRGRAFNGRGSSA